MKNKKNKNKNKNKKKRAPDPPEYLRPNSFVPRAPKGTHAGEGSLASEKVSLPIVYYTTIYILCTHITTPLLLRAERGENMYCITY